MRGRKRSAGPRAAAAAVGAMTGAVALALAGCGQSGPLRLPEEGPALAASASASAPADPRPSPSYLGEVGRRLAPPGVSAPPAAAGRRPRA